MQPTVARHAVSIVEAAYDFRGSDNEWLLRLARAASYGLPEADAVLALEVDLNTAAPQSPIVSTTQGGNELAGLLRRCHELAPAPAVAATYGTESAWISVRESFGARYFSNAHWLEEVRGRHFSDFVGIVGRGGGDRSCTLFYYSAKPARAGKAARLVWRQISRHIGAAQRLRTAASGTCDAVLRTDGTCLHAEGDARSADAQAALRRAARRMMHARRKERADGLAALSLWDELVEGTWSLVDQFDSDGQRYILARRCPQKLSDPRRLTTRERQIAELIVDGFSSKQVALELGLSPPTVSQHVSKLLSKLGAKSIEEMILLKTAADASAWTKPC